MWDVFDVSGKKVLHGNAGSYTSSGSIEIDAGKLPLGMYNVVINNGIEQFNRKLVVIQ